MKAFVTGITGFSGSHLAERLAERGWRVAGSSLHGSWPGEYAPQEADRFPLFRWDLSESLPMAVREYLAAEPPDVFFHLAGISTPSLCGRSEPSAEATAVNSDGPVRAAEASLAAAPAARFVFVSSCLIYGDAAADGRPVAETATPQPTTGYGRVKLEAERRLEELAGSRGLDLRIARSFQHAGPRQKRPRIVADWAAQFATDAEMIEVFSLDAELDLSDIRDVAAAYEKLGVCEADASPDESFPRFNVGSGRVATGRELLRLFQRLAPPDREIRELRPGAARGPIADPRAIDRALDWRAETPLAETVRAALAWQRARGNPA